jgi:hypothetical protein
VQITTAPTAAQANGTEVYYVLETRDSLQFYNQLASFSVQVKALNNVNQVGVQFFYATSEIKLTTAIGSEVTCAVNTSTFVLCPIVGQALGTSQTTNGVVGFRIRITGVSSGNTYDLNNGFLMEQVEMNLGPILQPWHSAYANIADEFSACERYYEKTFPWNTIPAQNTGFQSPLEGTGQVTNQQFNVQWVFRARKRTTTPTITTYSTNAASANWGTNGNTPVASTNTANDCGVSIRGATNVTAGAVYQIHATADNDI